MTTDGKSVSLTADEDKLMGDRTSPLDDSTRSMGFSEDGATKQRGGYLKGDDSQERTGRSTSQAIYTAMAVTAIVLGIATYFFAVGAERMAFHSDFSSLAAAIAAISEERANSFFGQLDSLAVAMAAAGRSDDSPTTSFPNVTVRKWDYRTERLTALTGADMVMFVPLVQDNEAIAEYAMQNQGWLAETNDDHQTEHFPSALHDYPLPPDFNGTNREGFVLDRDFVNEILTSRSFFEDSSSSFAPIMQYGPRPVNGSLALTDLLTHPIFKKEIVASLEYNVPVISEVEPTLDHLLQYVQDIAPSAADKATPDLSSETSQQILRSFTLDAVRNDFVEDSPTIGFVVSVVPWNIFFAHALPNPSAAGGMTVTVRSDCGSVFTYRYNDDGNDWVAMGDHHDADYNDLLEQFRFFWKDHPKGVSRHCHFDLHMYPSDEFSQKYFTKKPIFYAAGVITIFILLAAGFYIYNVYSLREKRRVMEKFARAETVLKSLFPGHVGDQVMQEALENAEQGRSSTSAPQSSKNRLGKFLDKDGFDEKSYGKGENKAPIADLYSETTVMIADIVGFTKWSSTRDPSQVFTLLESIYGAFDKEAKRFKVFKVETIGDSYVAVSGLPERRKDHHISIARFAHSCLETMSTLCQNQLRDELGDDTATLGLRVGLHSGAVTAGVLRGERARFQLFGDTINTAARMESTSKPNRIQLSQETADLLIQANKCHWIIARQQRVDAKGKGELQTYWLARSLDFEAPPKPVSQAF